MHHAPYENVRMQNKQTNKQKINGKFVSLRFGFFLCTDLLPGCCSSKPYIQLTTSVHPPNISQAIKAVKLTTRGEMQEMIESTNSNPHPGNKMCTLLVQSYPDNLMVKYILSFDYIKRRIVLEFGSICAQLILIWNSIISVLSLGLPFCCLSLVLTINVDRRNCPLMLFYNVVFSFYDVFAFIKPTRYFMALMGDFKFTRVNNCRVNNCSSVVFMVIYSTRSCPLPPPPQISFPIRGCNN